MAAAPLPAVPPTTPLPQPWGLPRGSVRALLALLLSGTFWYLVIRQALVDELLLDAVLLVVAFYFGVRSTAPPAPVAPPPAGTWQPLYLPRGSVRSVLLVGFVAVIAVSWYRQGTVNNSLLLIGQVLGSYVAGAVVSWIATNRLRKAQGPSAALAVFRHGLAALAVGVTGLVCWSLVSGQSVLPPDLSKRLLSWTIAFYFGSRLAP